MNLKQEFDRLFQPKDLPAIIESHRLIADAALKISYDHGKLGYNTDHDEDAYLLFQMTLMKSLSILKLAEGINHNSNLGSAPLNEMLEPFSMSTLVRSQYEAFCNFNNIYIQSNNTDELKLKYHLWVISGLNYRQRFPIPDESEAIKQKQKKEKEEIEQLEKLINENPCFVTLDEKSQKVIKEGIKDKNWQFRMDGTYSRKKAWHELMKYAGTNDMFDQLYSSLSFSTHPSNVSVFQFKEINDRENQLFLTKMALLISKVIMSMYIADYARYYPSLKATFESMPQIHQALINCYNFGFRNPTYIINEVGIDLLE